MDELLREYLPILLFFAIAVALSLAMVIALYRQYNTSEEDQILGKMK